MVGASPLGQGQAFGITGCKRAPHFGATKLQCHRTACEECALPPRAGVLAIGIAGCKGTGRGLPKSTQKGLSRSRHIASLTAIRAHSTPVYWIQLAICRSTTWGRALPREQGYRLSALSTVEGTRSLLTAAHCKPHSNPCSKEHPVSPRCFFPEFGAGYSRQS